MANKNVIQALHDVLRRESKNPNGKGESLEHACLIEMLNPESKAMLSDELKRRTTLEYPEELNGSSN